MSGSRRDADDARLLLELPPDATADDVVKAHRRLVRTAQKRASSAPGAEDRDRYERLAGELDAAKRSLLDVLAPGGAQARVGGGSYAVLGVAADADAEQVEQAYLHHVRLAQRRSAAAARAEDRQVALRRLDELARARSVLIDPQARAQHDQALAVTVQPGPVPEPPAAESAPARDAGRDRSGPELVVEATRHFSVGAFAQVLAVLDPLVRRTPPDPSAARLYGLAAWRDGQPALAVPPLVLARREHRADPEVAATLLEAQLDLGQDGDAAVVAQDAVREDTTAHLAVTRASLLVLCARGMPDAAVRIAEQHLLPRRAEPGAVACAADVLLAAADAHRTRLRDGRSVLTSEAQCQQVQRLVTLLRALPLEAGPVLERVRRLRVQLLEARRTSLWVSGPRWEPRPAAHEALVERWGTP